MSAKAVDAKVHGSVSDAATVQTILTSHDAQEEIKSAFLPIRSFAITVGRSCFAHLSSNPNLRFGDGIGIGIGMDRDG